MGGRVKSEEPPSQPPVRTDHEVLLHSGSNRPAPWLLLEPLPPLDRIGAAHLAYVRSVVARFPVRPAHWREDIVQEALIEAHRSRHSGLDVRALLFGITRHVVLRWSARRAAERRVLALAPVAAPVTVCSAEEERRAAERRAIVAAVVDDLPALFREVFVRAELEHAPMPAVARDLGIAVTTGYTRLHLARLCFVEGLFRRLARLRIRKDELL